MSMTYDELIAIKASISYELMKLEKMFDPNCKITFVMRLPGNTECELCIGNDLNLDEVIKVIKRMKKRSGV